MVRAAIFLGLGVAVGSAGCFADAPADDTGDLALRADSLGGAAHDLAVVVDATYRVPAPDDLTPSATFTLDDADLVGHGDRVAITFTLPASLLGRPVAMRLAGQRARDGGAFAVSGAHGFGTCRGDLSVECELEYFDDAPRGILRLTLE